MMLSEEVGRRRGRRTKRMFGSSSSRDNVYYYVDKDTLGLGLSYKKGLEYYGEQNKIRILTLTAAERVDKYYSTSKSWASDEKYSLKQKWTPQLKKIGAIIGPTSEQLDMMKEIVRCGINIVRLNFSHATVEEVELCMENIQACKHVREGNARFVSAG